MKIEITDKEILKKLNYKPHIILNYLFIIITIFLVILPFVVSKTVNTNTIIESVVYLVIFGSTFGYFSIRSLKNLNKIKNKLIEGNYYVVEDIIENIDITLDHSGSGNFKEKNAYITLKNWSATFDKVLTTYSENCKKLNNGQKLYLIFVNDSIFPITFFSNSEHSFTSKLTNLEEIHFKDNSQKIIKF